MTWILRDNKCIWFDPIEAKSDRLERQLFEAELSMELYKLILEEYDYHELVSALYGIFLPTFKK